MTKLWHKYRWIPENILGSTLFALGFALFLAPNNINTGGISGLAMVLVEMLGFGSVGSLSILVNLPLFVLGGLKIGRRYLCHSLVMWHLSFVFIRYQTPAAFPQRPPPSAGCLRRGWFWYGSGFR